VAVPASKKGELGSSAGEEAQAPAGLRAIDQVSEGWAGGPDCGAE
jgi:hypothetical protein